jgi:hypothetical protein
LRNKGRSSSRDNQKAELFACSQSKTRVRLNFSNEIINESCFVVSLVMLFVVVVDVVRLVSRKRGIDQG